MDLNDLTLNDSVPVGQLFTPTNRSDSLVIWSDDNPIIAQRNTVSVSRRLATPGNGNHKYSVRVKFPSDALDPDSGKPLFHSQAVMDFIIPEQATAINRADLMAHSEHMLTSFKVLIADGDFIF